MATMAVATETSARKSSVAGGKDGAATAAGLHSTTATYSVVARHPPHLCNGVRDIHLRLKKRWAVQWRPAILRRTRLIRIGRPRAAMQAIGG